MPGGEAVLWTCLANGVRGAAAVIFFGGDKTEDLSIEIGDGDDDIEENSFKDRGLATAWSVLMHSSWPGRVRDKRPAP